jgi:anti-sigma factor RsiW
MSCSHDPNDLIYFVEGNTPVSDLPEIQDRLRYCRDCQTVLAELLQATATLKRLRQATLPPSEIERWVHHLRRVRKQRSSSLPAVAWLRRLRPAPIVALLTLIFFIFSYRAILHKPATAPSTREELRLFLQEHAIAQDQGAFATETLSELLITENELATNR